MHNLTRKTVADYPHLVAQWHPTLNGDLKPEEFSFGSGIKVWWKCPVADDHEWEASVNNRTTMNTSNKGGCPYCSGKKVSKTNSLAATHPHIAIEWHPTLNGDLRPENVSHGSGKKVWWEGDCGHEWIAAIHHKVNGRGCPYCSGLKVDKNNCLATLFPEIASEWHPTKNGTLTPWNVTPGSNKIVWWLGKCGHSYDMNLRRRKRDGCPYCRGLRVNKSNCLATLFPEIASEWHPTKNGTLTPQDITPGSHTNAWWLCKKGHSFLCQISHKISSSRKDNSGCPYCRGLRVDKNNCLATLFPEIASEWHPTKNGTLTPWNVTPGSHANVWWLCKKCQHEWVTTPNHRAYFGCRKCNESKGEKSISKHLKKYGLKFKTETKFTTCKSKRELPFDFLVRQSDKNGFLIEYHGFQHYYPTSFSSDKSQKTKDKKFLALVKRDAIKKQWCQKRNIPLLEIPYWDFDRIEEILDDFFVGKEPTFSEPPEIVKKYKKTRQKILERIYLHN